MRRIRLTRGKWATVDDRFYEKLMSLGSWKYHKTGYAVVNISKNGVFKTVSMHREVLRLAGRTLSRYTDHRNRRKCDNRLTNLRSATNAQNVRNQGPRTNNTSGFKGVSWYPKTSQWRARITKDYQIINLGLFDSITDAASAYDTAAKEYHGEFACLNFRK